MTLTIKELSVSFDENHIIQDLNLELASKEIVVILGPSGCGKTTLLRSISGLQEHESGSITLNNKRIESLPSEHRSIGMLFQRPVLFPFKDVLGNILFAYKNKKHSDMDAVHSIMSEMGLIGKEQQRIETLSGGEAQRVVLARALLTNPELLLLDEPLSALDVELRRKIALEIRTILKSRSIPAIHVTHDPTEAEIIGDRIIRWNELQHGGDDEE
ncbi:MAG: ABC transporter ATP-binding protein [Candidatus Poseidoniaceae archaeon]